MSKRFLENLNVETQFLDISNWPQVLCENLDEEEKTIFLNRKQAVDLFMTTETKISDIELQFGFGRRHIYRFVKRCLEKDEFEMIMGYRALIPYKRLKNYHRNSSPMADTAKENFSGAFSLLLDTYPPLREMIINSYFNRNSKNKVNDPIININICIRSLLMSVDVWE
ncbi:hypothetical protein P4V74_30545 [Bacillus thuringiensis]|nr:hypothetical protein [Bacillus thuringiensis]